MATIVGPACARRALADALPVAEAAAHTPVLVRVDGVAEALIEIGDVVRPGSYRAVDRLRRLGVRPVLATGDREAPARAVACDLGIEEVHARRTPEEKAALVRDLREQGYGVAVVGDGVNDAAALAGADLGIVMGSGTDVAIGAADLTLVRGDIEALADAIGLARRSPVTSWRAPCTSNTAGPRRRSRWRCAQAGREYDSSGPENVPLERRPLGRCQTSGPRPCGFRPAVAGKDFPAARIERDGGTASIGRRRDGRMPGPVRVPRKRTPQVWPWQQQPARAGHLGSRSGGAWLLIAATVTVLASGCAWLGSLVGGMPGALVGCAPGLVLSGLLLLLVESAVSGPHKSHLRGPGAAEARRRLRRRR